MFHDERIIVEQGKAFRATMMLAWFISLLYGILHALSLYTNGSFQVSALISELVCLGSGLALFLYGEIKYRGSAKDEMLAYQKNMYYKKVFYIFIGIILFAFYLQIGLGSRYEWFPPNHFLFTLQIPCWLLLLTYFKTHGVPFNYSYLGENKNIYIRRTFANVLKLGKIVAAATGMGLIILIALRASILEIIAVLLSGILSWLSLAIEYLIISWAERVSDQANEQNRISSATLLFVILGAILYIISAAVGSYAVWDNGKHLTNGTTLMLVSLFNKNAGYLGMYFFGLFSVYLYSEMRDIKSKLFDRSTVIAMGSIIFAFVLEPLSQVVHYLIDSIGMQMGPSVHLVETTLYIETAVDYLLLVLRAVVLITATAAFAKKNIVKKTAYIYPTTVLLSSVAIHIWAMLSKFGQQIAYVVFSILAILLSIIIAIGYRTGKKACQ